MLTTSQTPSRSWLRSMSMQPAPVNGFATATVWQDGRVHFDLAQFVDGCLYWRKQRYS
jgi:hypothetical protein